jgi:hypothetical protein
MKLNGWTIYHEDPIKIMANDGKIADVFEPKAAELIAKAPEMYQALIKVNGIALANIGGIGAIDEEGLLAEMKRITDTLMPLISQIEGTNE